MQVSFLYFVTSHMVELSEQIEKVPLTLRHYCSAITHDAVPLMDIQRSITSSTLFGFLELSVYLTRLPIIL
jgi:hypothetical protein